MWLDRFLEKLRARRTNLLTRARNPREVAFDEVSELLSRPMLLLRNQLIVAFEVIRCEPQFSLSRRGN